MIRLALTLTLLSSCVQTAPQGPTCGVSHPDPLPYCSAVCSDHPPVCTGGEASICQCLHLLPGSSNFETTWCDPNPETP